MRIKELREINDIQQKELAAELNIPASTLSQYETGKREPNIEIVKKLPISLMYPQIIYMD